MFWKYKHIMIPSMFKVTSLFAVFFCRAISPSSTVTCKTLQLCSGREGFVVSRLRKSLQGQVESQRGRKVVVRKSSLKIQVCCWYDLCTIWILFIFETSVYIIQDIYIIYQKNVDVHIKRYFVNIYIYIFVKKNLTVHITNETWESLVNLAVKKKTHPWKFNDSRRCLSKYVPPWKLTPLWSLKSPYSQRNKSLSKPPALLCSMLSFQVVWWFDFQVFVVVWDTILEQSRFVGAKALKASRFIRSSRKVSFKAWLTRHPGSLQ